MYKIISSIKINMNDMIDIIYNNIIIHQELNKNNNFSLELLFNKIYLVGTKYYDTIVFILNFITKTIIKLDNKINSIKPHNIYLKIFVKFILVYLIYVGVVKILKIIFIASGIYFFIIILYPNL